MLKIALAQLNYHIGNFDSNAAKIIGAIERARDAGADVVVFAELAVCGYPPLDLLEFREFIGLCERTVQKIAGASTGITCILGAPTRNATKEGKDLYNSALVLRDGKVERQVNKALLPTYDVFDEYRYFQPAHTFACIDLKGHKVALTVCEDLWNLKDDPLYISSPMDTLIGESPELMINIAASPFSYSHDEERIRVLSANAKDYKLPLLYVNQVGAQTEILFDGGSLAFGSKGELLKEMAYFEEDFQVFEFDGRGFSGLSPVQHDDQTDIGQIHAALVLGIRDYFQKSGFSKAVLGLSGGIDSALVCALAAEALGAENVTGVLMPSEFSSDHSVNDALDLVKNLGCRHVTVPIKEATAAYDRMLEPFFKDLPFNIAEENIQARCRAILVMAFSNKFGSILLNTSNKSECAVGYGTLYGDMAGAIGVLGDVYKTQVYALCEHLNRNGAVIPRNTIAKPPSAELRPGQKDSDSLPDYGLLDQILYRFIEQRQSLAEIIAAGFAEETVRKVLKLINVAEFKRKQAPPILRVSPKAFGTGRRMPIVGKYLS